MKFTKFKRPFLAGIVVTLILAVIAYALVKVGSVLKILITPIAHQLGMENILGTFTITILAIPVIVILALILGSISLKPPIYRYKDKIEDFFLKIYPPLYYFKEMADEKFQVENVRGKWKSVLALINDQYLPTFIIEENEEWFTLLIVNVPNSDPMQLLIVRKDSIQTLPMTMEQMLKHNKSYGRGYLSMIPSKSKK